MVQPSGAPAVQGIANDAGARLREALNGLGASPRTAKSGTEIDNGVMIHLDKSETDKWKAHFLVSEFLTICSETVFPAPAHTPGGKIDCRPPLYLARHPLQEGKAY